MKHAIDLRVYRHLKRMNGRFNGNPSDATRLSRG